VRLAFRHIPLFLFLLSSISCSRGLTIMSYNVENLFDDVDNGTEYREYDPARGKWGAEGFALRVQAVAEVIRKSAPGGPDIILLQEVENENALGALRDKGLAGMGYGHLAIVPKKRLAANVAVLSRFPIARVHTWHVGSFEGSPVRDVLEVEIERGGRVLHLLANHWKSKVEGARATEAARQESSGVVARRLREILSADPAAEIVVAGDFNESHDEYARSGRAYPTALLPEGESVPAEARAAAIFLSGNARRLGIVEDRLVLYEPWLELPEADRGSYSYRGQWQTVDHMLLSPGLLDAAGFSYRWGSFHPVRLDFLLQPDGTPKSWDWPKAGTGYSDHLPLLLTLDARG
jgi:endonuclease/exonuclease/phosphatase family metal-dependent hydrolase